MARPAGRYAIAIVLIISVVLIYKSRVSRVHPTLSLLTWHSASHSGGSRLQDILNATLGFQEVFVINLPSRTDRRDAMSLAGAVTDVHLNYVNGVDGGKIPDKVLPADSWNKKINVGNKGSWRAHMNVLRSIVESNLTSALILEDDTDWDVRIKSQLQVFALASRSYLQPLRDGSMLSDKYDSPVPHRLSTEEVATSYTVALPDAPPYQVPKRSPYGDNWDVLWLGHCGTEFPGSLRELHHDADLNKANSSLLRISVPNDPTVPVPRHLRPHPFALQDDLGEAYAPGTRVVHASSGTLCTQAYAVSQAGARRLLHQFGLETFTTGFDLMLRDWCDGMYLHGGSEKQGRHKGMPMCLTVQPPLFSHWLFEKEASSDIMAQGGGYLHKSGSQYQRLSTRLNLARLVEGTQLDDLRDQWPDSEEDGLA